MQIQSTGREIAASQPASESRDYSSETVSVATETSSSQTNTAIPLINPVSHIEPGLGIVVVETYGSNGEIKDQYPTAHVLRQYSLYGMKANSAG